MFEGTPFYSPGCAELLKQQIIKKLRRANVGKVKLDRNILKLLFFLVWLVQKRDKGKYVHVSFR